MYSDRLLFLVVLSGICNTINSRSFADPLGNNSTNSSGSADNYIVLIPEINQPGRYIHTLRNVTKDFTRLCVQC